MMFKFAAPLALAASLVAGQAMATDTPTGNEAAAATACAQILGYAGLSGETVVVVPRGPASVNLKRYDTASSGKPTSNVTVAAFDLATCQPVELKIWVQDQMGKTLSEHTTALASFPASHFETGVNYIRAERALNRDLGFMLRGLN